MGRPPLAQTRENITSIRLTMHERQEMEEVSASLGFKSLGDYLRHLHNVSVAPMRKQRAELHGRDFGKLSEAHITVDFQANLTPVFHSILTPPVAV